MANKCGTCPHCGAPIYMPLTNSSSAPPPLVYTCDCRKKEKHND